MRLYIPNGSVASGRFISPRRRRRDGKIPQLSARMIFPPRSRRGRPGRPARDYLSRWQPTRGISIGPKAMCIFGNRIFISVDFLLSLSQNMAEILFRMSRIKERRKKKLNRLGRSKNSARVSA